MALTASEHVRQAAVAGARSGAHCSASRRRAMPDLLNAEELSAVDSFALIVASMATQHAKWLEMCAALPWRKPVSSLNILLTSTCWRNDHNGFSHQGPGFLDTIISKRGTVARAYLPPDANCLLSEADHCLRSHNYVNLIIIDKQPQLQWLEMDAARDHCSRGASIWKWASTQGKALKRARRKPANAAALLDEFSRALEHHRRYVEEHMEDLPEIRGWTST
jgi:phosphoketolase